MMRIAAVAAIVAAVIASCHALPLGTSGTVRVARHNAADGQIVPATAAAPVEFSFAFAGSAFLIHYYFGVMQVFIEEGVVDPKTTRFGGISGGAITSMLTCAGATPTTLRETFAELLLACRKNPVACEGQFSLRAKRAIFDKLPNNEATLNECGNGRVRVGMTHLNTSSTVFDDATPFAVDTFSDVADMEEAMLATSYLSCFVGPSTYTLFRGQPTIDGGYKANFEHICHPGTTCIKISAYVTGPRVDKHGPADYNPQCFNSSAPHTGALHNWPRFDNPAWKLPTSCAYLYETFTTPSSPMIYPGKYNSLPYTRAQWEQLSMCVGTEHDLDNIYNAGVEDAKAFLQTDYPALVAASAR